MKHELHIAEEAGGVMVTCPCGRIWWDRDENRAIAYWRAHVPKAKEE